MIKFYFFICLFAVHSLAIGQQKVIVAGPEWDGFVNQDGSGIYLDLLKSIYAKHDLKIVYENTPFKRATKWLEQNEVDIQLGIYSKCELDKLKTKYRVFTPVVPLTVEQTVVIYKKDGTHFIDYNSLTDQKTTWIRGYDYGKVLGVSVELVEVDTYKQAWGMLNRGRVKYYIDDLHAVNIFTNINGINLDRYHVKVLSNDFTYIGVSQTAKGEQLAAIYNQEMPLLLANGSVDALYEQYGYINRITGNLLQNMQEKCEIKNQLRLPLIPTT
jgi:ABC-type amino acid transport substrate-binding protein